ncbi:LLM class flavin-dependent oxidoreductase [Deinococcus sp. 6YEL10]|uniref:LLM class flavin-dependent oxidoreductase n=1 Tax=Deinococcus sp. 6YEL10 TaxID=2745870 RepID=UPI001E62CEF4|nr:LLM class flavin-dependent oxidoreductase [Deinococcus sp. 6YEL10]MCD0162695.1 LLM class flavin-dependent oxidoreductase [Deinococcus sp. 6YEL10]
MTNPSQSEFLWFLQLSRDGEFIGTKTKPPRRPTLAYLQSLISAAGEAGFEALLTATNYHSEHENYTAAVAALARSAPTDPALLIAVRPGMFHPAMYAKMLATLQNLFPGRVRLNIVTGSSPAENAMYGDNEDHGKRYERTREFMQILRQLWTAPPPQSFRSDLYSFENAVLDPAPVQPIPLYFGGASPVAQEIAADLADVYLMWGEREDMLAERLNQMRALEEKTGRRLRYGLRTHVIVRETEAEARAAAERLISRVDPEVRAAFVASHAHVDGVGQKRQIDMMKGLDADLMVEPGLWAGVGMARSGVGVALIGSPEQVAAKIRRYEDMGFSSFIFSGYPHEEEARRFGELVMPLLRGGQAEERAIHTDRVAPVA